MSDETAGGRGDVHTAALQLLVRSPDPSRDNTSQYSGVHPGVRLLRRLAVAMDADGTLLDMTAHDAAQIAVAINRQVLVANGSPEKMIFDHAILTVSGADGLAWDNRQLAADVFKAVAKIIPLLP